MTRTFWLVGLVMASLIGGTGAGPARGDDAAAVKHIRGLSFEFVGQFQNSAPGVTPATHTHYGYLSHIRGVRAFRTTPENEATAFFTFFADGATLRAIANGPLRIVTRTGRLSIYRDASGNGNFAKPETFELITDAAIEFGGALSGNVSAAEACKKANDKWIEVLKRGGHLK